MTCDDFRGIAINSILSKVFEHCILDKFKSFLSTNDNQFGFKKGLGCSHGHIHSLKASLTGLIPTVIRQTCVQSTYLKLLIR